VRELQNKLPPDANVPFGEYARRRRRCPTATLPTTWFVEGGKGRFLDNEDQLAAAIEKLQPSRRAGDVVVSEGPDSPVPARRGGLPRPGRCCSAATCRR
jgi:hypothetical protein